MKRTRTAGGTELRRQVKAAALLKFKRAKVYRRKTAGSSPIIRIYLHSSAQRKEGRLEVKNKCLKRAEKYKIAVDKKAR